MCYRFVSAKKEKDNMLKESERLVQEIMILREQLSDALTAQENLERKSSASELLCRERTKELEVGSKY
jgi:hypothetical protein